MLAGLVALGWQLRRSGARIGMRLRPLPKIYVIAPPPSTTPVPASAVAGLGRAA
jgi:hypothetical protein